MVKQVGIQYFIAIKRITFLLVASWVLLSSPPLLAEPTKEELQKQLLELRQEVEELKRWRASQPQHKDKFGSEVQQNQLDRYRDTLNALGKDVPDSSRSGQSGLKTEDYQGKTTGPGKMPAGQFGGMDVNALMKSLGNKQGGSDGSTKAGLMKTLMQNLNKFKQNMNEYQKQMKDLDEYFENEGK